MTRLAAAAWPVVAALAPDATLLVPIGSTEQHGPHLPLTTDTDIAEALAAGASARDPDIVLAPSLPYGSSGEHRGFAGTLSIGRAATESVLVELVRSARASFDVVLLLSAHGGNAVPLSRALDRLTAEGHHVACWSPTWRGDLHAGRTETSLMLAIDPGRVDLAAAAAGNVEPPDTLAPLLRREGVRAASANGVLGDPSGATVAEGRRLLAAGIDDLLRVVRDARRRWDRRRGTVSRWDE